jgi:DNA-binding transcriptional regulator GbsR (MarR family)
VARSNVSTSLKELQNWDLVQTDSRIGDRRDYFQTSADVWTLFLTVVEQRVEREIVPTLTMLRSCAVEARAERPAQPAIAARISAMQAFLEDLLAWYSQIKKLPPSSLRSLIRIGSRVTRILPKDAETEVGLMAGQICLLPWLTEAASDRASFQRYYEEAGPDYAAWSAAFNMHFGFFRWDMNPFKREAMLEQMNQEILRSSSSRTRVSGVPARSRSNSGYGLRPRRNVAQLRSPPSPGRSAWDHPRSPGRLSRAVVSTSPARRLSASQSNSATTNTQYFPPTHSTRSTQSRAVAMQMARTNLRFFRKAIACCAPADASLLPTAS